MLVSLLLLLGGIPRVHAQYPSSATGAYTVTQSGNDVVYTFTNNGTFTPSLNLTANLLLVGGGGGGGGVAAAGSVACINCGGGGGGGAVVSNANVSLTSGTQYTVNVGAGGNGGPGTSAGSTGGSSLFGTYTAAGGGGGGSGVGSCTAGANGGCGGGGGYCDTNGVSGGGGTGSAGGNGSVATPRIGGGGGGAGVGGNGANGGAGAPSSLSGSSANYGGGGGGGAATAGNGGSGGGGSGAGGSTNGGAPGAPNTGGGGGGAYLNGYNQSARNGGNGGAGMVIVRYSLPTCTINASAGTNGSIMPSGTTNFSYGGGQTYAITPNSGYVVNDVVVDGASVGPTASYTFSSISADHTVRASFVAVSSFSSANITNGNYSISQNGRNVIYTFKSGSGAFTPAVDLTASLLVVGGGGGGGGAGGDYGFLNEGGGGGGGGLVSQTGVALAPSNSYTVTVGTGGAAGTSTAAGGNGTNSVFGSYTAMGGGGGGSACSSGLNGIAGASGGGGARYPSLGSLASGSPGSGTSGQGNDGARGDSGRGGGGGGAGYAANAQNGGNGTVSSITGTNLSYAGGGGAGTSSSASTGGTGGGGAGFGSSSSAGSGTNGIPNTGGGGGGGANGATSTPAMGGAGGSGVVIISYAIKTTPTVNTWPIGSSITPGQALSASTLTGGSASVPGTFAFTTSGAKPPHGIYSASVTFTPTDTSRYTSLVGAAYVVVNTPPAAGTQYLTTKANTPLTVGAGTLAGLGYDADKDKLSITAVNSPTTCGGTVSLSSDTITYTPPSVTFVGSDSFTYILSDGFPGSATTCTAKVTVTLASATSMFTYISTTNGGTVYLRGYGVPGTSYELQRAGTADFSGYSVITTLSAASGSGVLLYTDTGAPNPSFYRFAASIH